MQWQQHAHVVYTVLFFLFFLAQIAVALVLIVLGVMRAEAAAPNALPLLVVPVAIITAAFVLLLVNSLLLSVQAFRDNRELLGARQHAFWLKRWTAVLFGGKAPPQAPLPSESVAALLDLKDSLDGEEAEMAFDLVRYYGFEATLVARLASRRRSVRLAALESLGKLRSPDTLPLLLAAAKDPYPPLRYRALRAVARTVAVLPPGAGRERAAAALLEALKEAALPLKATEELLMLLGAAAPGPVAEILRSYASESYQRVALEVAGRLGLGELGGDVARFISAPNPELRAAALKALSRLGSLPPGLRLALGAASRDEADFVRAQAARAVALLPQAEALSALYAALGDRSWWVRRAAAQTLLALGEEGEARLSEAEAEHPDRYGRDAARQALLDAQLQEARVRRLEGRA